MHCNDSLSYRDAIYANAILMLLVVQLQMTKQPEEKQRTDD